MYCQLQMVLTGITSLFHETPWHENGDRIGGGSSQPVAFPFLVQPVWEGELWAPGQKWPALCPLAGQWVSSSQLYPLKTFLAPAQGGPCCPW